MSSTLAKKDVVRLAAYIAAIVVLAVAIVLVSVSRQTAAKLEPLVTADLTRLQGIELRSSAALAAGADSFGSGATNNESSSATAQGAAAPVLLRKLASEWEVSADGSSWLPARQSRVSNLISELESALILRVAATSAGDGNNFGLPAGDRPGTELATPNTGTITLLFPGEARIGYELGRATSLGGEYFARISGESRVLVVPSDLAFSLGQQATYWTELRLWPDRPVLGDITELVVSSEQGSKRYTRGGDNRQWVDDFGQVQSDLETRIRSFLDWELAERFAAGSAQAAAAGAGPAYATVTLTRGSGAGQVRTTVALHRGAEPGVLNVTMERENAAPVVGTILEARTGSFFAE